jgi:O-antigen/teichoic acid export membrane protein
VGVYMDLNNIAVFAKLWVLSFCIGSVGLTLYLWYIRGLDIHPRLTFFTQERLKPMLNYASYMGVGAIAGMFVGKLDLIMVGTLASLKETGIYGIALFIANVLMIPATGVWQISSPVISDAFKNNNWERIKEVYTKSSTNLMLIGVIMYFFILGALEAVFSLSSRYHDVNVTISLFTMIGLTKLMDMGMGVNQLILTYSSKYRIVAVFVLFTAILNITLNYFLIRSIGILGAALAACITTYVFQLLKYSYVVQKFGIHPFSRTTPKILVLFTIVLIYYVVFPDVASPVLKALLYCTGLVCIYVAGIRLLKIESDVTEEIRQKLMRQFKPLIDRFSRDDKG